MTAIDKAWKILKANPPWGFRSPEEGDEGQRRYMEMLRQQQEAELAEQQEMADRYNMPLGQGQIPPGQAPQHPRPYGPRGPPEVKPPEVKPCPTCGGSGQIEDYHQWKGRPYG